MFLSLHFAVPGAGALACSLSMIISSLRKPGHQTRSQQESQVTLKDQHSLACLVGKQLPRTDPGRTQIASAPETRIT